jgi:hypothetical protein
MTAAWVGVSSWAPPEELRTLVESAHAAALYFGGLPAAGVPI